MPYIGTQPKDVRSFGRAKFDFTATQGQTAFTGADDDSKTLGFTDGQIEVYVNGILMDDSDFTTSNGNTVTLASAANLNDIISIVAMQTDIPNSDYVPASGGSFTGAVTHTGAFTSKGIDDNADAIAITIDTSENVLVNAADTDPQNLSASSNSGVAIRSDGRIHAGAWQQRAAAFGRGGTDGEIATFRKDGSTIGEIGTYGGDMTVGTGDTRVRFIDSLDCIVPVSDAVGTSRDAAVDLGYSDIRYKNLYLSGGAYIGGTGAANHLDDYETGSFTMTMTGESTGASLGYGVYVKVGNMCHFNWYSGTRTISSAVVPVLTGLPFNHTSPYTGSAYASVVFAHNTYVSNAASGYINIGTNSIYFTANNSSGGGSVTTGSKYVMCSGSYYVD